MEKRDGTPLGTLARLTDLEGEYDMTLRVLAVVVERLCQLTGAREVRVADSAVTGEQPDLVAWRNADEHSISLTTSR